MSRTYDSGAPSEPIGDILPQPGARSGEHRERPADTALLQAASDVLTGRAQGFWFSRLLPFLGPAFVASVAYMDPGNYATNIQGGARYGYTLLWVVFASNLMAMLIQSLSAKLASRRASSPALHVHCCWYPSAIDPPSTTTGADRATG